MGYRLCQPAEEARIVLEIGALTGVLGRKVLLPLRAVLFFVIEPALAERHVLRELADDHTRPQRVRGVEVGAKGMGRREWSRNMLLPEEIADGGVAIDGSAATRVLQQQPLHALHGTEINRRTWDGVVRVRRRDLRSHEQSREESESLQLLSRMRKFLPRT